MGPPLTWVRFQRPFKLVRLAFEVLLKLTRHWTFLWCYMEVMEGHLMRKATRQLLKTPWNDPRDSLATPKMYKHSLFHHLSSFVSGLLECFAWRILFQCLVYNCIIVWDETNACGAENLSLQEMQAASDVTSARWTTVLLAEKTNPNTNKVDGNPKFNFCAPDWSKIICIDMHYIRFLALYCCHEHKAKEEECMVQQDCSDDEMSVSGSAREAIR